MSLTDILTGEFFTEYIKGGNVLMLSEATATTDNLFTLQGGELMMYVDKETYERAGLVGKPYGVKGKRGSKPRWIITYNLKDSSMLHGKKGFERLLYACKHVLNQPVTWLFCDAAQSSPQPNPLSKHAPIRFDSPPGMIQSFETESVPLRIPPSTIETADRPGLEEWASELYEWFSLVRLASPRARANDAVDPFLSRYSAPDNGGQEEANTMQLCKFSWQGLMTTDWLHELLVEVIRACPGQSWLFISATAFSRGITGSGTEVAFLRPPEANGQYLLWEISSAE